MNRRQLGQAGERVAAAHLEAKGYRIVARNVFTAQGELDLVASAPDGTLAFVEVRTRRGEEAVSSAAESIDERKRLRVRELAAAYLAEHAPEADARIDVVLVAVSRAGRVLEVRHIEDAM